MNVAKPFTTVITLPLLKSIPDTYFLEDTFTSMVSDGLDVGDAIQWILENFIIEQELIDNYPQYLPSFIAHMGNGKVKVEFEPNPDFDEE
jgi:hypothetical protein